MSTSRFVSCYVWNTNDEIITNRHAVFKLKEYWYLSVKDIKYTPEPRPLKKGTFDSNAAINSEGSGDMSSTQYNQIWSSANSFFRNRQKFACFLEHWPEILIAVNWQWSLGKNSSLSKNWDYWEIAENMVKMHNLVNKSCCKPRLQSKSHLSKKLRLPRKTENF